MAKKREKIERRRQINRTRRRVRSEREVRPPRRSPPSRDDEKKASARDLWIAGGVIFLLIVALVILYQVSVRRPTSKAQPILWPSPGITIVTTPESTPLPTPKE